MSKMIYDNTGRLRVFPVETHHVETKRHWFQIFQREDEVLPENNMIIHVIFMCWKFKAIIILYSLNLNVKKKHNKQIKP